MSKVTSNSIPKYRYDNVGEPSFANNGSIVFYTGNHYAARSMDKTTWEYVDPFFDFKGNEIDFNWNPTYKILDLFWADQRAIFDSKHNLFIWLRQGEIKYLGNVATNIDRLAVSKDLNTWTVYDLRPRIIFGNSGLIDPVFDYPELITNDKYLYLTSGVFDYGSNKNYGSIVRFSLNDLGNLTATDFTSKLDEEVKDITPVDGTQNPVYFGTHLPDNSSKMKIYSWEDNSNSTIEQYVNIQPWNDIHNSEICGLDSELWWCKAHTSSKIRSSWLYNNSINFLWNAVVTYDNGTDWHPYIDVATFDLDTMSYERKYHLSDESIPWIFGAAIPGKNGLLGIIGYYTSNNYTNPYLHFAFGIFDHTDNKWKMTKLLSSSNPLPVINEDGKKDYNWGDFLTIRKHPDRSKDDYIWDAGGYILVGKYSDDIEPYFITIK